MYQALPILRDWVKRGTSVCDVTTWKISLGVFVRFQVSPYEFESSLPHCHSCPFLSELQSVQTMHPKLYHQLARSIRVQEKAPLPSLHNVTSRVLYTPPSYSYLLLPLYTAVHFIILSHVMLHCNGTTLGSFGKNYS